MPSPARQLLNAVHTAKVPAQLSSDAGSYLCNYLCWQAAEAARQPRGPRLAAFIHVPNIPRFPRSTGAKRQLSLDDLLRAGERALVAMLTALRR